MTSYSKWDRAAYIERVGGPERAAEIREQTLMEMRGARLAEIRRERGLTQAEVAERMGVTKGRVSQIEQGKVAVQDVLDRYALALGGHLGQAIYFDDGTVSVVA